MPAQIYDPLARHVPRFVRRTLCRLRVSALARTDAWPCTPASLPNSTLPECNPFASFCICTSMQNLAKGVQSLHLSKVLCFLSFSNQNLYKCVLIKRVRPPSLRALSLPPQVSLWAAFRAFDHSGDGHVAGGELACALRWLGVPALCRTAEDVVDFLEAARHPPARNLLQRELAMQWTCHPLDRVSPPLADSKNRLSVRACLFCPDSFALEGC